MQHLYRSAAVVTVFAVFEHFLGFLYRIILSRLLGPEGLGVYQVALTVFAVFLTISSSGLPITLSRVISKHRAKGSKRGEQSATAAAILIALMFSLPITLLLFLFRTPFSSIFSDPRCADLFYILIFGLSFTSVYSIIRGYFWGNKRFFAYSVIELIEEIIKISMGVFLLLGIATGFSDVNKAAIAVLISYLCSFVIAVVYFIIKGGRLRSPKKEFLPLLKSSLPVTAMRTSSSLMNSLISVVFPMRLMAAGFSSSVALSEYGVVYGMVMPVLMTPGSFIGSLAVVLVPTLAECYYRKETEESGKLVEKAIGTTLLIACLLIPLFIACGENVGIFLFNNAESGKMLRDCALVLLPMSITMISTSLLNSINCERQTLFIFLLGSAAMLLCVWFLPEYLGSGALLLGMACDFCITAVCSLFLLRKKTGKLVSFKTLLRIACVAFPAIAVGIGCNFVFMICLDFVPATLLTMLLIGLTELLLLWACRFIDLKQIFRKIFLRLFRKKSKKARARS